MRFDDLPTLLVRHADDCTFSDVWMGQERGLHFRPGDVIARGNDHVVATGDEMETASSVLDKGIAGQVPAVAYVDLLPGIGEITTPGRPADRKPAKLPARLFPHGIVDDLSLIARNRPAGTRGRTISDPV